MGVQPIDTVGETFDPNFHEAVAVEESTETPPNTIVAEMLRGYRIGNRVIRHSMVKVTTAPPSVKKGRFEVDPEELVEEPSEAAPESDELLLVPTDTDESETSIPEVD
jgi:molecular chaperone GrpE